MEKEKREERKEIVVLDEGTAKDAMKAPGPESVCCWASLMPFRS